MHNLILFYTRLGAHSSETAGWIASTMLHGADHHGFHLCDATSAGPFLTEAIASEALLGLPYV